MNNVEQKILMSIIDNPTNMGNSDSYVEIEAIEEDSDVNPNVINVTIQKLFKQGYVNINRNYVKITNKGLSIINDIAA